MIESARKRQDIKEEASNWLVQMSADDVTADERARFQQWLDADIQHSAIYRSLERSWCDLAEIPLAAEATVPENTVAMRPRRMSWRFFKPLASAAILLVAVVVGWRLLVAPSVQNYTTEVAEIRDIKLQDGSVISLGARSAIDVAFNRQERRVWLKSGEAFFDVATDIDRPFIVIGRQTYVRVIGTQFDIHTGPDRVRVSVLEGVVEVAPYTAKGSGTQGGDASNKRVLEAGQKVSVSSHGEVAGVEEIGIAEPGAWREGRLIYDNAPLKEVLDDANRYYPGHIQLAATELADRQVVASFRSDQIDEMLHTLSRTLPIRAVKTASGDIVIMKRPDA